MSCHARVVGPNLMLGQPEVNLGIIPGYGGTQRLPRLIGLEKAAEMLRTASTIGAEQSIDCMGGAMPVDEYVLLSAAQDGARFAELCDSLSEWHTGDAIAKRAWEILQKWLDGGLLSSACPSSFAA